MKIAQVVSTFPPYQGGMGNVAYQISDKLSNLKYDVSVFTPRRNIFDHSLVSYFKIRRLMPILRYGNAAIIYQLFWKLWNFKIVHLHYPFIGACMPIVILKAIKRKKMKLIFHYHMDLVGQSWKSVFFKCFNNLFLPIFIRISDKVIVTSKDYFSHSLLAKYQKKFEDKIIEIPNGVDVDFFKPSPASQSLMERYELKNKKVILFVGALDHSHYFKGVNYLLKSVQNLERDDLKLILVGDGDLKQVYIDLAQSYEIYDQVIFTGYVPDEELIKYYNLCDFFVLPSVDKSEAFGMVLLEAMSCAKPVIATDLAGVRQVVDKKVDGRLVRPKDAKHLSEQIKYFLDNPIEIRKYGHNGRIKVLEKYSWDIVVKKIVNLYKI